MSYSVTCPVCHIGIGDEQMPCCDDKCNNAYLLLQELQKGARLNIDQIGDLYEQDGIDNPKWAATNAVLTLKELNLLVVCDGIYRAVAPRELRFAEPGYGYGVSGLFRDYLVIAGIPLDKATELSSQFDRQIEDAAWLHTYDGTTFEKKFDPKSRKEAVVNDPNKRMYECKNCNQVVQGFNAQDDIECCANKNMQPVKES